MQKRRVVVTGAGLVTPAGQTLADNWTKMVKGETTIEKVDNFDVSSFPSKLGGMIKGFDPNKYIRKKKNLRFLTKDVQYCLAGVKLACEDSRLDFEVLDPSQIGLYVGSGESEVRYDRFFRAMRSSLNEDGSINYKKFGSIGLRTIYPAFLLLDLLNNGFCYSSIEYGLMGINNNFSCGASAGPAIGEAFKGIQRAEADIVIAGGYDSLVSCFENYFLQSATGMVTKEEDPNKAMKPYSAMRDGFVPGEGAGFVVLEELNGAIKRHAPIRGEILGYSCNCDTNEDLLEPDPQGEGLFYAARAALDDAEIDPSQIEYVNSEGNATPTNDVAETRALKRLFGKKCYEIPVSTVKPIIGYPGAASSAIDFVVTLLALEKGIIPPTTNYTGGDAECDLDYVPDSCRTKKMEFAMSVNKGSGGQNCVLVLRHFRQ
jgi:3-oxoacyl-[acyl-carrier-protein] synthase II